MLVDVDSKTNLAELCRPMVPMLRADPRVPAVPAPSIGIAALVHGGMAVAVRAYTLPGDNASAYGHLSEQLQGVLTSHRIGPPAKKKKNKDKHDKGRPRPYQLLRAT